MAVGSLRAGPSHFSTGAEMQTSGMEKGPFSESVLAFRLRETPVDREVVVAFSKGHADVLLKQLSQGQLRVVHCDWRDPLEYIQVSRAHVVEHRHGR